jgi:uncharacterized damage-inducible protein DinB
MTDRRFCIARRKAELPAFLRVLKAVPAERLDYRPHPKSRSAAELAWTIVSEETSLMSLLDTGTIHWKKQTPPGMDDMVAMYEQGAAAVTQRLERLDDNGWQKKARFLKGDDPPWENTVGDFVWLFLFDAIHHRGQLSTYLRPMGGRVPSIYGPSGDYAGA